MQQLSRTDKILNVFFINSFTLFTLVCNVIVILGYHYGRNLFMSTYITVYEFFKWVGFIGLLAMTKDYRSTAVKRIKKKEYGILRFTALNYNNEVFDLLCFWLNVIPMIIFIGVIVKDYSLFIVEYLNLAFTIILVVHLKWFKNNVVFLDLKQQYIPENN